MYGELDSATMETAVKVYNFGLQKKLEDNEERLRQTLLRLAYIRQEGSDSDNEDGGGSHLIARDALSANADTVSQATTKDTKRSNTSAGPFIYNVACWCLSIDLMPQIMNSFCRQSVLFIYAIGFRLRRAKELKAQMAQRVVTVAKEEWFLPRLLNYRQITFDNPMDDFFLVFAQQRKEIFERNVRVNIPLCARSFMPKSCESMFGLLRDEVVSISFFAHPELFHMFGDTIERALENHLNQTKEENLCETVTFLTLNFHYMHNLVFYGLPFQLKWKQILSVHLEKLSQYAENQLVAAKELFSCETFNPEEDLAAVSASDFGSPTPILNKLIIKPLKTFAAAFIGVLLLNEQNTANAVGKTLLKDLNDVMTTELGKFPKRIAWNSWVICMDSFSYILASIQKLLWTSSSLIAPLWTEIHTQLERAAKWFHINLSLSLNFDSDYALQKPAETDISLSLKACDRQLNHFRSRITSLEFIHYHKRRNLLRRTFQKILTSLVMRFAQTKVSPERAILFRSDIEFVLKMAGAFYPFCCSHVSDVAKEYEGISVQNVCRQFHLVMAVHDCPLEELYRLLKNCTLEKNHDAPGCSYPRFIYLRVHRFSEMECEPAFSLQLDLISAQTQLCFPLLAEFLCMKEFFVAKMTMDFLYWRDGDNKLEMFTSLFWFLMQCSWDENALTAVIAPFVQSTLAENKKAFLDEAKVIKTPWFKALAKASLIKIDVLKTTMNAVLLRMTASNAVFDLISDQLQELGPHMMSVAIYLEKAIGLKKSDFLFHICRIAFTLSCSETKSLKVLDSCFEQALGELAKLIEGKDGAGDQHSDNLLAVFHASKQKLSGVNFSFEPKKPGAPLDKFPFIVSKEKLLSLDVEDHEQARTLWSFFKKNMDFFRKALCPDPETPPSAEDRSSEELLSIAASPAEVRSIVLNRPDFADDHEDAEEKELAKAVCGLLNL